MKKPESHTMLLLFYTIFVTLISGKNLRIVGGEEVGDTTSFPWLVAIISRNVTLETDSWNNSSDYYYRHFCGGSIINESWILTAAHCLLDIASDEVAVVAGTYNLSAMTGQLRHVEMVYVHEYYNYSIIVNDIALLKLAQPLVLNESAAIILLANKDDPLADGQIFTLAGWGALDVNGTFSPILNSVEVPGMPLWKCANLLEDIYITNICAGGVRGEDSCSGDSGGGMTMTVDYVEILYGIVSWGMGCASENPGVYTAVSMYRDWIEEVSGLTLGNRADDELSGHRDLYITVGMGASVVTVVMFIAVIIV